MILAFRFPSIVVANPTLADMETILARAMDYPQAL
jgi:hypothetical protein